jgi:hypothetical protein
MDGDQFFYLNDGDVSHPQITRFIDITQLTVGGIINLNTVGGVDSDAMIAP